MCSLHEAGRNRQQGIALLLIIIVIALTAITFVVSTMSARDLEFENNARTNDALKKAKKALLAYAANYPEITGANRGPGYLPCPDLNNDGVSVVIGCNPAGVVNVGRFPWVTLGAGDLRDGANEGLWYAVADTFDYTNSPTVNKVNSQTAGNITVRDNNNNIRFDGTTGNGIVAVILAPGEALVRSDAYVQDRSQATGDPNDPLNYLDIAFGEDNASFQHGTLDGFISGVVQPGAQVLVNDIVEVITYDEIMQVIHRRVAGELANSLIAYADIANCGNLPEASAFDPTKAVGLFTSDAGVRQGHVPVDSTNWDAGNCADGLLPAWLEAEDWHKVTYYHVAASVPCTVGVDCLTITNVNPLVNDAGLVVTFAGRDLNGVRHINNINEYYENENADLDLVYDAAEPNDSVWTLIP